MRSPFFATLRDATHAYHDAVDRRLPLGRPDLTRPAYAATLRALLAVQAPLEARLAALPAWRDGDAASVALGRALDLPARRRTPALRRDLTALGLAVADMPAAGELALPELTDVAQAIGCLYVLEGATLGGRVVLRTLPAALGVGPDAGAAFLASHGDQVGPMWRRFQRAVDGWLATRPAAARAAAEARAIDAARATFAAIDARLAVDFPNAAATAVA